ncbi:MAG: DUF4058 family protein [Pirellulaceae bacterium]|nr:DUF4058 family protein [Pirellulaceae bacterium]
MPIHNWTLATAGTYHDFHLKWIAAMTNTLNAGLLPPELFAMAEQVIGGPAPAVVTLRDRPEAPAARLLADGSQQYGGVATLSEPMLPPKTEIVMAAGPSYVRKKSQIAIKHEMGQVISVIELVSPGNKHSRSEMQRLVSKSVELIENGIHLLVVDPFPATPRDPQGIANLIWQEIDSTQELPYDAERPLIAASFQAKPSVVVHLNRFSVGDAIPEMPVFLIEDRYVTLPLDETYQQVWTLLPQPIRRVFEAVK